MDKDVALKWLTWLYGETFEGHVWIGGHLDGFGGRLFAAGSLDAAVDYAATLDLAGQGHEMAGVYHRLTTMREVVGGRGKVEDSVSLPALMMDLDIRGPGHKADTYPENEAALRTLLADAGVPEPSTWINSGGGRYAVWKLDAPAPVHDADVLLRMQERARSLHRGVIEVAKTAGFKVDNTSDLARVYRLPGTTNRKPGVEPVTATWAGADGARVYAARDVCVTRQERAEPVRERVEAAAPAAPAAMDWRGGMAGLFGQGGGGASHSGPRGFTVTQAMAFVRPALAALAVAADGEINVRLNEAACALAHFGEEFWSVEAADRQLLAALDATEYDGRTWKAEDTIASARRGMSADWRGMLVPEPVTAAAIDAAVGTVQPDAVDALIAEMLSPEAIVSRPAPKFMIHGLLQFDSESWLIGPAGSKKSFTILDMAARVIRGEHWQGRRTNPADVVMIVAEGAGGVGKRVDAWQRRYGAIGEGLYILPRPVQAGDPAQWAVLVGACRKLGQRAAERGRGLFVVLDTQARVTVGLKENDATDMGVFVSAVGAIRAATGACVLPVHHTGRTGGDARGSSAIDGAQTTELKVSAKGKLTGRLSVEKQKDIEEIEDINLAFEVVELGLDADGERLTSLVMCEQDSTAFRLAWAGGEVTEEGLALEEQAKVTPFKARTVLDSWIGQRSPRAMWQHWIVQALVDTAGTLGLTQSEVRDVVAEKRGKADNSTWRKAWQSVTDDGGQWSDVVLSAGGQRWTVDHLRAAELLTGD